MAARTNHKNMHQKKLSLPEQLASLEQEAKHLQVEIDRPVQMKEARLKEHAFGVLYWNMDEYEKDQIQKEFCEHCIRFMAGDMEHLASFFGMCKCMWQRYVARTYRPRSYDPFDMNDYRKDTRYKEIAAKAQRKMDILTVKMAEINEKIENNEKRRKQAEAVKASYVVDDAEVQRRLLERKIQAAKNQKKMAFMKEMNRSPVKKKHRRSGHGRKQSSV